MSSASYPAPPQGESVRVEDGRVIVPDRPIIPFIEGDGIGPDIWSAARRVLEAAVDKTYGGQKGIIWYEVFAGEKANERFGEAFHQVEYFGGCGHGVFLFCCQSAAGSDK